MDRAPAVDPGLTGPTGARLHERRRHPRDRGGAEIPPDRSDGSGYARVGSEPPRRPEAASRTRAGARDGAAAKGRARTVTRPGRATPRRSSAIATRLVDESNPDRLTHRLALYALASCAMGIVLRLVVALASSRVSPDSDMGEYLDLARAIASGAPVPLVDRPFLYPAFLAWLIGAG